MWICPNWGRTFRNANQNHTCQLVSEAALFQRLLVKFCKGRAENYFCRGEPYSFDISFFIVINLS